MHSDGSNPTGDFALTINLSDCAGVNERIFTEGESSDKESASTIESCEAATSKAEQIKIQRQEPLSVLQLLMLNKDQCAHEKLEKSYAPPMEPGAQNATCLPCQNAYPC